MAIKADSGDVSEIKAAITQTADFFGRIDILVNNAGLFITGPVNDPDADIAAFNRQFAVNVTGVASAVRAVTAVMGEGGRIISIGSTGGDRAPYPAIGDYVATKAAIAAYTRAWARDLGPQNITVNTIQPGLIDTDMNPADGAYSAAMVTATALGRYGKAADIAAAVAFLASEEANYITGTTLNVDGGQSA